MFLKKICFFAVTTLALQASFSYAATIAEVEGNDSFASPQNISSASFTTGANADLHDDTLPTVTIEGDIDIAGGNNNDVDFYCFNAVGGSSLFLDIDYAAGTGVSVDTILHLFDATGTLVAFDDDTVTSVGGSGSFSGLDDFIGDYIIPSTGLYCATVSSYDNFANTLFSGTTNALSLGGASAAGATIGDTTFQDEGGGTGDYTLHISTNVVVTPIIPVTSAQNIPSLSTWGLIMLVLSMGLVGIRSSRRS